MQLFLILSVIVFRVAFGQFIAAPVPFDTADLFVAPTATSVISFGGAGELTESSYEPTSLPSAPTVLSGTIATTSEALTTIAPTFSSSADVTTTSEALPTITAVQPSSSHALASPEISGGDDVVTIINTKYTTVPCTTSATPSDSTKTHPDVKPTVTSTHAFQATSETTHSAGKYSVAEVTEVQASPSTTPTSTASTPTTLDCAARNISTAYSTTVLHAFVTEVETLRITQTHLITVSL